MDKNKVRQIYPVCGALAAVTHFLTVIIGGMMLPGYDHFYNTISELTVSTVASPPAIVVLLFLSNMFLIFFSWGLAGDWEAPDRGHRRGGAVTMNVAAALLSGIGLLGLAMLYFRQDPRVLRITFDGKIHLGLAWLTSPLILGTLILAGMSFKHDARLRNYRVYTYICCGLILLTGGLAVFTVPLNSAFGGLWERLAVGGFCQWVLVISGKLWAVNKKKG